MVCVQKDQTQYKSVMRAIPSPELQAIDPSKLGAYSVERYGENGQTADVVPVSSSYPLSADNIREIVAVCNQEAVYGYLFQEKLHGEAYTEVNAHGFEDWANKGWETGAYFPFVIKTKDGQVIGAVDIKSNSPEEAEIGYWMDSNYRGYMTQVVIGLIEQARAAGFRSLKAHTKLDNVRSGGVLSRAGFKYIGTVEKEPGVIRKKYVLALS